MTERLAAAMERLPLVAILRGVAPDEVAEIGRALVARGFCLIEVPLNSPEPFRSIEYLRNALPADVVVGAGTVLRAEDVARVKAAGGEQIVCPHSDMRIIEAAKAQGMAMIPGVATPTEAFAALAAGADALKLFPAEMIAPPVVKAMLAILPAGTAVLPVGGITPEAMRPFVLAGARGFGLGSALYKPGMTPAEIGTRAEMFAAAWRSLATGANAETSG
jgi:2-dehydro-3-deoxyphosphogalactonate aldolase